ncbi:MAG TPA: TIM barrel protein [Gemmataceae bacterium]|jgi:sugar phosphate isomerase/epimerase|nr:TIM barrel protein [Gemmataceae bacterium]
MMKHHMDRREFLQAAGAVTAGVGFMGIGNHPSWAAEAAKGAPHAKKLGWRLGCQAWTFNDFSFYEAVDKTASLGLHYIEAFPGQKLSPDKPDEKFGEGLSAATRKDVKKHLSDSGVKLVSFGVGGYSKAIFEFAKDMGIENLVSEPPFDAFDDIDKLCEEFKINLALHDHPKPSPYWNPKTVLKVCKGHSKRIGACCDTGHWMRSEINPLDALKMLEGRIIEFHFKDLNKYGEDAHDVPWGTGKADVKALLTEVKRQGIKPVFSVEYEYHFGHSLPELAKCVEYFDKVAAELAGD